MSSTRLIGTRKHVADGLARSARLLMPCLLCGLAGHAMATTRHIEQFGTTQDGVPVQRVVLENDRGMRLSYIDYGATLLSIDVPDRQGKNDNIILSLPTLAAYEHTQRRFAAIIGRYAGRIGNARFPLGDRIIELVPGKNGATLHGGPDGYERRVWQRRDFSDAASIGSVFSLVSLDGDQHFPGRLEIDVTYRLLRNRNELRIEYAAQTDAPTVVNFTNHAYFNLAGAGKTGLDSHTFQVLADRYLETDAKRVPTGAILNVAGTALDLRKPTRLTQRFDAPSALLGDPPGFDHTLVLSKRSETLALAAVVEELQSGRRMQVRTTEPSVLLNSGDGFDGSEVGSEGVAYQRHDGFALETQHFPDSPNHADFPSTTLVPGKAFHSMTSLLFSAR